MRYRGAGAAAIARFYSLVHCLTSVATGWNDREHINAMRAEKSIGFCITRNAIVGRIQANNVFDE